MPGVASRKSLGLVLSAPAGRDSRLANAAIGWPGVRDSSRTPDGFSFAGGWTVQRQSCIASRPACRVRKGTLPVRLLQPGRVRFLYFIQLAQVVYWVR